MLAVYANCVDGPGDAINGRIDQALMTDPCRAKLGEPAGRWRAASSFGGDSGGQTRRSGGLA
jgi:hypothetical protein